MTPAMQPDELYGLALGQFIPERAALVKSLRADKRRDEAAAVAALRKPSVAAWAVNQVVRSQGKGVQELFAAGDALRDAQARLLAGTGDGRALRAASDRERAAVDELVRAARGLLSSDGHELSPAVIERVADTLHAAALDEDAREQVRAGRLERELRHVGLGLGDSENPFATAPKKRTAADAPATRVRKERKEREREHAEARKAARLAAAAARRRAEQAAHALKAAELRRERSARALEQADEALAAAQAQARDAAAAQEQAQAELDAL